jgi:hypothetical protein
MAKVRLPDGRVGELSRGETLTVGLVDGRVGTLTVEFITPAKAVRWARANRGKLTPMKIKVYENLMRQGRWRSGGRICIEGGFVIKGKNALNAVANAGISQEMQVLRVAVPGSSHPELR